MLQHSLDRLYVSKISEIKRNVLYFLELTFSNVLQDRGRAPKLHLHETVEEMKKFNARRKLKVCIYILLSPTCMSKIAD